MILVHHIEKIATSHGDRLKVIPIDRLQDLKLTIEQFKENEDLNNFQQWIIDKLYRYKLPNTDFTINSILLLAIHHPFYAKVNFYKGGEKYTFLSLVRSNFEGAEAYLIQYAKDNGYHIKKAKNLPLKRLGVHSGLAKYGRNNITYIDGFGSNFSYAAYFSDLPSIEDTWGDMDLSKTCSKCNLCIDSCPTGAIRKDRFLIDNQKCLSCINEIKGEFPEWIPLTAHHTLYDCLICQRVCPMNHKQLGDVLDPISFTEEETNLLLKGESLTSFSEEAKSKIYLLGIHEWYSAIPRNLQILFEHYKP
ncbi:4Fe-4S binding protein [Mobilitalea sibirica]|uniref:4Fe-4S binding protein n=1 Tax=Mobilitalea sibirica TaxID=1462919 RepID=A0A8J7KX49_9FIRM|nr:4Fe-4S double cluster binding domain-containing protein [Mobilitalea sibirica]MBH1942100.1 4Fe-4S binding protein [Mobilitalea sibirica]